MKRRCLIIAAPGDKKKGNYLPGVPADLSNFCRFLKADHGGAWESGEISSFTNPTSRELQEQLFLQRQADYSIVFFSGHGGISTVNNETYVEYNNSDDMAPVSSFVNLCKKELVVIDTCRSWFTPAELGGDLSVKAESFREDSAYRLACRQFYDSCITIAEPGFIILYAASQGEAANDSASGGIFTQFLLSAGDSVQNGRGRRFVLANDAFWSAEQEVTRRYNTQHPCMVGSTRRRYWFPLSVGL